MAKTKISEWSSTAGSNTDIDGINLAEGMLPSDVNNALREMMSQLKNQQAGLDGDNFTVDGSLILNGATSGATTFQTVDAATATITLPSATGTLATLAGSETLTNKTVALGSNTVSGTTAQFNTALSDGDFATLAGSETLTNKALNGSLGATTPSTVVATTVVASSTIKGATTIGVGNATPSASGAGITFPATQSDSTDANTLDDYEEGTWTPTDGSGAGLSFTINGTSTYTKIGKQVICRAGLTYPVTASGANANIGGLPFATASNGGASGQMLVCVTNAAVVILGGYAGNASTTYTLAGPVGAVVANSSMSGSVIYFTFIFSV